MCRLFGFCSETPAALSRPLAREANSLLVQSNEHKDGWGIAYYDGGRPIVARGVEPAFRDPEFERFSAGLSAKVALAHVRLASVGAVHLRNSHPFLHGEWAFAHNGTVREFLRHQEQLEALVDPSLRALIRGETDSERCFYAFLTQLGPRTSRPSAEEVARALARTLRLVSRIADRPGLEPSSLTFLVTDGRLMVATRRRRTLFFSTGRPRGEGRQPARGERVDPLVLASEELSAEEQWHEVPEEGVVGLEADHTFCRWSVAELER